MNKIKYILLGIMCNFTILTRCNTSNAAPLIFNHNNFSYNSAKHELLNNRAIILRGNNHKKITIGNEKVAKRYRSRGIEEYNLELHHILFKGIRNTFPVIPYLCMQAPKTHHTLYHNQNHRTDIYYNEFTNMQRYLNRLMQSIASVSGGKNDIYSGICIHAANLAVDIQKHWIEERYSWLYNIENGRILLLAQRLLAKNCFPNQIIANKMICESQHEYILSELYLSHYIISNISSNSPASHLKSALKGRFNTLKIYTNSNDNIPNLSSAPVLNFNQVNNLANQRYKDSERFYNPISHMREIAGELSDSDASSLGD